MSKMYLSLGESQMGCIGKGQENNRLNLPSKLDILGEPGKLVKCEKELKDAILAVLRGMLSMYVSNDDSKNSKTYCKCSVILILTP